MTLQAGANQGDPPQRPILQVAENFALQDQVAISQWLQRRVVGRDMLMISAPAVAGHLTDAAVTAAITTLNTTINNHETDRAAARLARENITFTDRFGEDIANQVHRICCIDSDANLADVHVALAKNKQSSRDSAILAAALLTAVAGSPLPVAEGNAPKVTSHMLEMVRRWSVSSNGVEFGEGMSPFAIVCQGHPNAREAKQRLEEQDMVERGGTLSLQDARTIAVSDARMPTCLQHVVDKLYGSVVVQDMMLKNTHVLQVASNSAAI